MSLSLRVLLFSSFALTLSAQSGAGVVSIEELRNPLAAKSLRAILTAHGPSRGKMTTQVGSQHCNGYRRIVGLMKDRVND